ncbi:PAS domain-containing protein [Parvularcula dongshanensis]|uniref:histidine kinase n=1 Tax=Parvularcula dongshanensis TaxID=1173995 RepID=A0A840HZW9_9PROT|nr:PAS domain-containing protein [Parvularcula dongshanensis]MBB4657645.1 PAS domain S-box-containing protein [Parvularcula dongshanensis]
MNDEGEQGEDQDQAHRLPDDAPARFRANNPEDQFSGASGVLFEQAMAQTRMAICLTDPNQEDDPIVFSNRAFRELTGYLEEEIVGRNCRFLQGPDTNRETVERISQALRDEDVIVVELLNYRKDGTPFWNALHIGPIYNQHNELLYFFGSQWDVTDVHTARADERHAKTLARELSHRMKNMFSVIGGIVTVTGRTRGVQREAAEINDRIQALGRAYETTLDDASVGTIEVGQAIRAVLSPYDPEEDRINYLGNGVRVDPNVVSTLGLTLHELATNASKYGALSRDDGTVDLDWYIEDTGQNEGRLVVVWTEAGGPTVHEPVNPSGTGNGIIDTLLMAADGRLDRDWRPEGLKATICVPMGR